jgi:fructose-1,6-bisphosphatase
LDIQPKSIHERTSLVIGSRVEMEEFQRCSNSRVTSVV